MHFSYMGGIEKGWSGIAMYLERLRMQVLKSLECFLMYAHYGRVSTIPIRDSTGSLIGTQKLAIYKHSF